MSLRDPSNVRGQRFLKGLAPAEFNRITLGYDGTDTVPNKVKYWLNNKLLVALELTYDSSDRLTKIKIVRS